MSKYKYPSVEDAKDAISIAKISGLGCDFEDLTQDWVIDAKHPKFRMFLSEQLYFFELAVNNDLTILKSEGIDDASVCLKMVNDARKCVTSNVIYFATSKKDIMIGEKYDYYSMTETKADKIDVQKVEGNGNDLQESKSNGSEIAENSIQESDDKSNDVSKNGKTLAESLKEMKNLKTSNTICKKTLYEYLNDIYGKEVILNKRDNKTKTGLLLADTYYTYYMQQQDNGKRVKKKVCFAYVYEDEGACLILARLDTSYVKELNENNKSITKSKFPKAKSEDWYSIVANDTYTDDEIYEIMENAKKYCEKEN
jgi:predicted DNA-binding protein (MmcQ/YjbR family)